MDFYNDIERTAAEWMRELIREKHLPNGVVDERSIADIKGEELQGYRQCHFFAGIGGWAYALRLAGWPATRPVWTGSCPCQPFSQAGASAGVDDERHLWPAMSALIRECHPHCVFGEQVSSRLGYEWLDGVRADLESQGYTFGTADLPAACVAAPHIRQRLFWVANSNQAGRSIAQRRQGPTQKQEEWQVIANRAAQHGPREWLPEPQDRWVVDGLSANVGAVRGFGNAIVPQVAATFIRAFLEIEGE